MVAWQPGITLAQMEKDVIYEALRFFRGNKVQTARALDITPRTLYNKLEIYEGKTLDANGVETQTGDGVESVKELPAQQPVPLRERSEVQEMSSRSAPASHNGHGSKRAKSQR